MKWAGGLIDSGWDGDVGWEEEGVKNSRERLLTTPCWASDLPGWPATHELPTQEEEKGGRPLTPMWLPSYHRTGAPPGRTLRWGYSKPTTLHSLSAPCCYTRGPGCCNMNIQKTKNTWATGIISASCLRLAVGICIQTERVHLTWHWQNKNKCFPVAIEINPAGVFYLSRNIRRLC